ncbi:MULTISPECIES: DUF2842 domain-containing protein [unclassified Sphingobium]|uniref:DUF2842 domain-containing protein n=1 Tax=unclassified Sphingobium TaxID=2611147 RepID=UPI0022252D39|nr:MULTISPECIES: DUF2842 domain-containing protein [unclassified Sphingobium]MCW2395073.1 putative membrane channel-forming protein YqfA (hemolysin III family) [Sphingobium sp. B8D3B]MCW2418587.1 putative membrane channel-forming protein YqfA (hemolysin III family) [Sphingobium sp. B8D3C]
MNEAPQPSWRKPAGMFAILGIIAVWAAIIGSFSEQIARWPGALQLVFYVIVGIIWIFPTRPILVWMETGRWRA